jgi:hypothetical protein
VVRIYHCLGERANREFETSTGSISLHLSYYPSHLGPSFAAFLNILYSPFDVPGV